jgi:hypothetical protein
MLTAATKFLSTLQERLNPLREDSPEADCQIDDIRHAMLNCLGTEGRSRFSHVEHRILGASSVRTLWFLRPELLMALATHSGEQAARRVIDDITVMFQGLLPESLSARPSSLQR